MDQPHPLMILLQVALFGLLVAELALFARLHSRYAASGRREFPVPENFPDVDGSDALEGFDGTTRSAVYRWDRERRAILFRRKFGSHQGVVVGRIRLGSEPTVLWRAVPSSLLVIVGGFLLAAAVTFAFVGGDMTGGGIIAATAIPTVMVVGWVLHVGARRCLEIVLPEISEALRTHLTDQDLRS